MSEEEPTPPIEQSITKKVNIFRQALNRVFPSQPKPEASTTREDVPLPPNLQDFETLSPEGRRLFYEGLKMTEIFFELSVPEFGYIKLSEREAEKIEEARNRAANAIAKAIDPNFDSSKVDPNSKAAHYRERFYNIIKNSISIDGDIDHLEAKYNLHPTGRQDMPAPFAGSMALHQESSRYHPNLRVDSSKL